MTPEPSSVFSQAVFSLSPAEKLQLVEDLWDDISRHPDNIPVHPWQIEAMDRRKRELEHDPESGLSWEEMIDRLRRLRGGG